MSQMVSTFYAVLLKTFLCFDTQNAACEVTVILPLNKKHHINLMLPSLREANFCGTATAFLQRKKKNPKETIRPGPSGVNQLKHTSLLRKVLKMSLVPFCQPLAAHTLF